VKHTIHTGLEQTLAKKAIDKAMDAYKARFADYNPRFDWTSADKGAFGFNAKGVALGGTVHVHDHKVDVEMEVPFLFKIFQGRAMQVIEEQVQLWVEKARRGELD
jgi:hypothetical protein